MKVNDTVAKLRAGLLSHELYAALGTPARMRVFMERHVCSLGFYEPAQTSVARSDLRGDSVAA